MTTQWQKNSATSYAGYFRQQRPAAPPDTCLGATLSQQSNSIQGHITETVSFLKTNTLSHRLSDTATLNLAFVKQVLSSSGPIISPVDQVYWQWAAFPKYVRQKAATEQDYYPWLEWVIFRPAVHAVAAVRDQLYTAAAMTVPPELHGVTETRCTTESMPRGVTDIVSELEERSFTAHEIKRSRVLMLKGSDGQDVHVLEGLVNLAKIPGGFLFKDAGIGLEDKARRLICQTIMCSYTSHLIHNSSMLVGSTLSMTLPLRSVIWLNWSSFIYMHYLTYANHIHLFLLFQPILLPSLLSQGYLRPVKVFFARVLWYTEESSLSHQPHPREFLGHYLSSFKAILALDIMRLWSPLAGCFFGYSKPMLLQRQRIACRHRNGFIMSMISTSPYIPCRELPSLFCMDSIITIQMKALF
ncbi:hypothetical protein BT96DRAFT_578896 [Gymnopus androsaceus JB14]|uniref:Uncharacterized protein n=1 Tax=Gymnopus androsaceus JB14 TaxID=1447944 RepID=A0A6A4GJK0_9AGAR|nr:hypothetical protein BT96DRAFT_578896 [Gymnopus androsaceus JB14]